MKRSLYKMGANNILILFCCLFIVGVSWAQVINRFRNFSPLYREPSCSCTCEDLGSLLALARLLDQKEPSNVPSDLPNTSSPTPAPANNAPSLNNVEELIMKLVNALIYTTTQVTQHKCVCPHTSSSYPVIPPGSVIHTPSKTPSSEVHTHHHPDEGLLNVGVLNSNKKDNILDLDIARQHLIGVGLGDNGQGTGEHSASSVNNDKNQYNTRHGSQGGRTDGSDLNQGLNIDLLNKNKNNNIADIGLNKQPIVGVGIGGGNEASVPQNYSPVYNSVTGTNSESNNGGGLINVDLLKNNNVLDDINVLDVVRG